MVSVSEIERYGLSVHSPSEFAKWIKCVSPANSPLAERDDHRSQEREEDADGGRQQHWEDPWPCSQDMSTCGVAEV